MLLIFCSLFSYSQNVGIGTNTPHASAALDVKDSTRGILIPRMTMAQRNAIQNPAEGLMVYQTDSTFGFWYWGRGLWRNFRSGNNSDSLALVTTNSSTSVTYTTAVLNATITSTGGEMILLRGFFMDTVPFQTINNIVVLGNNVGSFSYNSTGLIAGKKYYARAFATNANGTALGDTISFTTRSLTIPTLTTETITNITNAGATCGGNITNDGGSLISNRGVCYSTSPNPTINNSISVSGTGTGNFLTTLTGLNGSSTYYVRAFATNAIGTAYGEQRSFATVTLSAPTVTTDEATVISYTSATTGLTVSNNGGSNIISQGVCYATTQNPTINNSIINTTNSVGHYSANIVGLNANTTYFVRAFSTNAIGTSYGNQISFTTLTQTLPVIVTKNIISITSNSAISGGEISSDGGSSIIAKGVCWSTTQFPTKDSSHTNEGTGIGLYNSSINGLSSTTTYFVRAYATNSIGTSYGEVISFTTTVVYPTITSVPIVGTSIINYTNGNSFANGGGYVTSDGGSQVTERGICWGSTPTPTVNDTKTIDGSGLGFFNSVINNLFSCSTTIYVRAYAKNATGIGYGSEYNFVPTSLPGIQTTLDSVNSSSAYIKGVFNSISTCPIVEKGVCWGISPNPTFANNYIISGSGNSNFVQTISGLLSDYTYHCRLYASNGVDTIYSNDISFTTGIPTSFYIGQYYAGGYIFYLDNSGQHGLICSTNDINENAVWGCSGININTSDSIGSGATNTASILASCSQTGIGAKTCNDIVIAGYSDWYLPSFNEAITMCTNLWRNGLGNFSYGTIIMSSTQYEVDKFLGAFLWNEELGDQIYFGPLWQPCDKSASSLSQFQILVRPIRRF